ncbi:MAG: MFS transporter [Acutalibacteraceae bacterium]|nr:MFS transporter [Acutalibacteraceae bacterium]
MSNKKNPKRFWAVLVVLSLIGQIAWVVENMYFNVFIYKMFSASAEAISVMVTASAVTATLTTIIIGALSDKIGKRKMFICGGYILWGISIISFAFIRADVINALIPSVVSVASIGVSLTIIMDCVMTFFGSSANDACFNAWLTESADDSNRGAAEGINAMMPLLAVIAVFGGFMGFDLNNAKSWTSIYLIIGVSVLVIGVLGIFFIEESVVKTSENNRLFKNIFYGFMPTVIKKNPILYITLGAFAVFGISIQVFMPYLILYYNVSLQLENYVLIMAPAIIIAAVVTAFYGKAFDKFGFQKSVIPTVIALCSGYIILYFFKIIPLVFIGSLLMMCGYLCGSAVFGAMIRQHIPESKAGMFQGLRIVGQVLIPGVIGPVISAAVLKNALTVINDDGTASFIPSEKIFLAALIVAVLLIFVLISEFYIIKRVKNNGKVQ